MGSESLCVGCKGRGCVCVCEADAKDKSWGEERANGTCGARSIRRQHGRYAANHVVSKEGCKRNRCCFF